MAPSLPTFRRLRRLLGPDQTEPSTPGGGPSDAVRMITRAGSADPAAARIPGDPVQRRASDPNSDAEASVNCCRPAGRAEGISLFSESRASVSREESPTRALATTRDRLTRVSSIDGTARDSQTWHQSHDQIGTRQAVPRTSPSP